MIVLKEKSWKVKKLKSRVDLSQDWLDITFFKFNVILSIYSQEYLFVILQIMNKAQMVEKVWYVPKCSFQ